MFTLAYELAHVMIGKSAVFNLMGLEPGAHATEQF